MHTLVLLIEYDGTNYSGWQIQPNATSIQEILEQVWFKLTNQSIKIIGSGRTDSGVHARGQVASAIIEEIIIPEEKLIVAFNSALPSDIRILNAVYLNEKFNARFDAKSRIYHYYISWDVDVFSRNYITRSRKELNIDLLNKSASLFLGSNDFTTFSKFNPDIKNNICIVNQSIWNYENSKTLKYTIEANHFLYGMVRGLVGSMLDFERGKYDLSYISECLTKPDRTKYIYFAPPMGLFLAKVNYSENINKIIYGS